MGIDTQKSSPLVIPKWITIQAQPAHIALTNHKDECLGTGILHRLANSFIQSQNFTECPLAFILRRRFPSKAGIDFTGTSDHVAGMMQDIMEEVGGDGFLLFNGYFDRRYIMEVCDGLVPELQRRGLTRKAYAHKTLRENLLEF